MNTRFNKLLITVAIAILWYGNALANGAGNYVLKSPDKRIETIITFNADGKLLFSLNDNGNRLIEDSPLGYSTEFGHSIPDTEWALKKSSTKSISSQWSPLWGKREAVEDKYNELNLRFERVDNPSDCINIKVRCYDDGVAFRYCVPPESTLSTKVSEELTRFNFSGDYTAWFYNGELHNIGPEKLSDSEGERMPVMTIKVSPQQYMAIHEADLKEGAPMRIKSEKGENSFRITTSPDSLKVGYESAWRTIFCADSPGKMVDSHLLELLNPDPEKGMDFSWVKPGISLWDWRINGAEYDGFRYAMDYPSWVRMVDFAANQGFQYLMLDANWYGPEFSANSDPVKGDKANDVKRIIKYAKDKGVGIWLYLNDVGGKNYPLEETLHSYSEWGAAGVKYGFMFGKMDMKNQKTKEITRLCAKYKLLIDFHDGPVHPYGQMRTWPNAVTREYCKAQLDGKEVFYPKTFVTSVFVNMIAGPLDMNNGMFDLREGPTTRVDNNKEVPSTVAAEAARTLITFSGTTVIPDIPEYYKKHPSLLKFLSSEKMPWRESQTLAGEIGEYIVMMRQASDGTFLIGAATDETGRTINIPLSFLPKGEFELELTTDASDSHYLTNREKTITRRLIVKNTNVVPVTMAPGGGACLIIKAH